MDYQAYLDAYNSANESAKERFFTEDVTFELDTTKVRGRDHLMAMLEAGHVGVKEELRLVTVAHAQNLILAEVDACFNPSQDLPNNFFHHFKKGQPIKFRFFASYTLKDGRIDHMRLSNWPTPEPIEPF